MYHRAQESGVPLSLMTIMRSMLRPDDIVNIQKRIQQKKVNYKVLDAKCQFREITCIVNSNKQPVAGQCVCMKVLNLYLDPNKLPCQ